MIIKKEVNVIVSKVLDYEEYLDKRVKIRHSDKSTYRYLGLIGMRGVVERTSSSTIGVRIDGKTNQMGSYGVFWFRRSDLEILENESEEVKMEGFKYVAIVNLLEDYNKKDYFFALYETEFNEVCEQLNKGTGLVVVNPRGKDNRVLGAVKGVLSIEEYGKSVTAQVIGTVNMDAYNARVDEENRVKEIAKKKAEIQRALDVEIEKRKNAEYYERMAKEYSDNPYIVQLVKELKELGV